MSIRVKRCTCAVAQLIFARLLKVVQRPLNCVWQAVLRADVVVHEHFFDGVLAYG